MLVRSTSTRRTRGARNSRGSTQQHSIGNGVTTSPQMSKGRRASVATDKLSYSHGSIDCYMDRQRSPRGSMVPNIALDIEDSSEQPAGRRILPDPEVCNTFARGGLTPGVNRSPRNSLVPEDYPRSPRGSLVPPESGYNRSPRNSLVPGALGQSRNSLLPNENGNCRSPRGSISNIDYDRSPRGSICLDASRSPRSSIVPTDVERPPREPATIDYHNSSPRSPRGSIAPDTNRSPRGSICPENNRSPRGSIVAHEVSSSPRGSLGQTELERVPRGSIAGQMESEASGKNKSPRGSIGPEIDKSPRGSLGGHERRIPKNLSAQDPRRASADQGRSNFHTSSYRQRDGVTWSGRTIGNHGAQTNLGYGTNVSTDSRRASSSVSQFSGDESRRLCGTTVDSTEKDVGSVNLGIVTYSTFVFQLKDAHREATSSVDFVYRAMTVVSKTMTVTAILAGLTTLTLIMLIMGLKFSKDCPRQEKIPIYMIVTGALGSVRMCWGLYIQIRSRRLGILRTPNHQTNISPMKCLSAIATAILVALFILGNYWILSIKWPEYEQKTYKPDDWCNKKLYIFALVHLGIIYTVILAAIVTAIGFALCRFFACSWFEGYK